MRKSNEQLKPIIQTGTPSPIPSDQILQIGSKQYARPAYVAGLLNVTRRTLNRWGQARKGPPKILVGHTDLYDLDKLATWLESNETSPLPAGTK